MFRGREPEEGERTNREIKKKKTDEVKRGDVSVYVCRRVCACVCSPAVALNQDKIDCLARIICPRHFEKFPSNLSLLCLLSSSCSTPLCFSFLTMFSGLCSGGCCNLPNPVCKTSALPLALFHPHYDLFSSLGHTPIVKQRK